MLVQEAREALTNMLLEATIIIAHKHGNVASTDKDDDLMKIRA